MAPKFLLVIAGPTAVGKTALSIRLAQHFSTEIISADSRQVYQEMSIGTAKPTADDREKATHHLIDCVSIHKPYSAGNYELDALKKLDELYSQHQVVVLCGGTGLYIKALCNGFDEGLKSSEQIRRQITEMYQKEGLTWLQAEVKKCDETYYHAADKQNPQRLMRALEVYLVTGKAYSSLRKEKKTERPFIPIKIFVNEERGVLYQKINNRVDAMMQQGFLKEAEALYPYKHELALKTVGYTELFDFIEGKTSLEKAVERIKQHTRNYAKRQVTWFKNDTDYAIYSPNDIEKIISLTEITMQKA
ncbi:MAG: tRNA (adenosine(37)-N6)-dimethylallyltransferase MiaA [Bacteroidetes bacterium]|nr:tRNA (adenosine(37)-N6)-dimethylallyltransferase MiaA [Bacteroidota bacterium]